MGWENFFGHAATVDYLRKNIASGKFPHAVIFAGTEGIGKRTAADICAAALLCDNPVDGSPCGVCESCRLTAAKSHPDFYIVEPEANKTKTRLIKIGQIRAMQSEAALRPINSERRVVIIDGAELMNNAAANCLLKTIEEPPSQTIFVLVTANLSSLPITIRSRCMTVHFDRLPPAQIQDALIARGVEFDEARRLSVIAGGSFGRALTLKDSGGAQLREDAFNTLEKISRGELNNEDIFTFGATVAEWPRDRFADFVIYIQKILRDVYSADVSEPLNPDLSERTAALNISEQKIFALIETGTAFHRRLKSNASLRLMAEAYLMSLRKIFR